MEAGGQGYGEKRSRRLQDSCKRCRDESTILDPMSEQISNEASLRGKHERTVPESCPGQ